MVERSRSSAEMREVRGLNLASVENIFRSTRLVRMNGWMRACEIDRARPRSQVQDQLCGSDDDVIKKRITHLSSLYSIFKTDIVVSDFEKHLGQGLGKNAPFALKFGLWLYIVKMVDLKWKSEVHVLQLLRKSLYCQKHI